MQLENARKACLSSSDHNSLFTSAFGFPNENENEKVVYTCVGMKAACEALYSIYLLVDDTVQFLQVSGILS